MKSLIPQGSSGARPRPPGEPGRNWQAISLWLRAAPPSAAQSGHSSRSKNQAKAAGSAIRIQRLPGITPKRDEQGDGPPPGLEVMRVYRPLSARQKERPQPGQPGRRAPAMSPLRCHRRPGPGPARAAVFLAQGEPAAAQVAGLVLEPLPGNKPGCSRRRSPKNPGAAPATAKPSTQSAREAGRPGAVPGAAGGFANTLEGQGKKEAAGSADCLARPRCR